MHTHKLITQCQIQNKFTVKMIQLRYLTYRFQIANKLSKNRKSKICDCQNIVTLASALDIRVYCPRF